MPGESELSKRLKLSSNDSKKESNSIDRISNLTDSLLTRILSLLPTKHAVATSILSTRWKFLWTSVTNLHFDDDVSKHPKKTQPTRRKKFTYFVNRVLLLLNPPSVENFRLRCHQELCDPLYLNSWICAAFARTTKELYLYLGNMEKPMELPLKHFYCKTLSVLKLSGDIHFNISASASICFPSLKLLDLSGITFTIDSKSSVSFPKLKALIYHSVKYANEESVHKLFQSCLILDNLRITRMSRDNIFCLNICIPSLRSLRIHFSGYGCDYAEVPEGRAYKLKIDAPALQYLDLEDFSMCEYFTAENLSSLLEAKVKIYFSWRVNDDSNSVSNNVLKFIEGLSNVKFLSISFVMLKAIRCTSANLVPVFHNLMRLELNGKEKCGDWCGVVEGFLHSLDNLEHLIMDAPAMTLMNLGGLNHCMCLNGCHRKLKLSLLWASIPAVMSLSW